MQSDLFFVVSSGVDLIHGRPRHLDRYFDASVEMVSRSGRKRKTRKPKKIGEYLVGKNLLSAEDVQLALEHQERWGSKIGEALVSLGRISEEQMYRWLARFLKLPYLELERLSSSEFLHSLSKLLSHEEAVKHRMVPIQFTQNKAKKKLVVATSEPMNLKFLDELKFRSGADLLVMVSPERTIEAFIARLYKGEERLTADPSIDFYDYFTHWVDPQEIEEETEPDSGSSAQIKT